MDLGLTVDEGRMLEEDCPKRALLSSQIRDTVFHAAHLCQCVTTVAPWFTVLVSR